ncbi:hypothetical protein [Streptomyces sp. NPDC046925]|uniref:hypothetical protein n=1 Tax=Streptomyces sp. NPDC046925 TaxID=3155375 RepID=UPI0033C8096E
MATTHEPPELDPHTADEERRPGVVGDVSSHPVGTLVVDTDRRRIGRVMGHEGPYVQLRPPGGGREWDARPGSVRPADADDRLRASIFEVRLKPRGPEA